MHRDSLDLATVWMEGGEDGWAVQLAGSLSLLLVPKACMMPSTKRTGRLPAFPFIIPLASTEKSVREICELNVFRVLKFSLRPCLNQCVILNYLPFECLCLKCTALSLLFVRDC